MRDMNSQADAHEVTISVDKISKSYGAQLAVKDISFQVAQGSCVGLLGPNGAGKTTALSICLGLSAADSGTATVLGQDMPRHALSVRARIGVVPQANMLDPDFNCIENLQIFARYFGLNRALADQRIPHLLNFAGLTQRAREAITNLSGGMQRRLTLARALINDPELVLLDEPTTGLDPQARHMIWERLRQLQRQDKTLLLVTHFMEEAERLCDYVYIVDGGVVIAAGSPPALVSRHTDSYVLEMEDAGGMRWLDDNPRFFSHRESFGDVHYGYCDDIEPVLAALASTRAQFRHRRSNLEDVFLKLTGRALRE